MENPHDVTRTQPSVERIKVTEVTRGKNPTQRVTGCYEFDDLKTEGAITCNWRLQPELVGLSVHGNINGTMLLECARCLEPYQVPIALEIHERYVFSDSLASSEKERELQADDFYETVDEEGELDLKDLAHQFLILESIEHPNCERPECRFA